MLRFLAFFMSHLAVLAESLRDVALQRHKNRFPMDWSRIANFVFDAIVGHPRRKVFCHSVQANQISSIMLNILHLKLFVNREGGEPSKRWEDPLTGAE